MHRASGFKLKSTIHQVLDIGVTRYSTPFFLEPAYYSEVPKNLFEGIMKSHAISHLCKDRCRATRPTWSTSPG